MRTEYRITGRFRSADKRHVVDWNRKWTLDDTKNRLREIQHQTEWEMKHKKCKPTQVGMFGISREYYSDYDLLELRIESREVSPWTEIGDDTYEC